MWHILYLILSILLITNISCTSQSILSEKKIHNSISDSKQSNASNRILVKFKPETDSWTVEKIQKKLGLETVKIMNVSGLYLMQISDDTPVKKIIESIKQYDEVIYAEPDYKYKKDIK